MNQERIGDFIKKLRKDNNMTQAEFATKYGVTYQAVSNWEHGKNLPDISLLKQISKDFNVSIDELLEGENKVKETNKNNIRQTPPLKIVIFLVLLIILVLALIFFMINRNDSSYEFKTLSSSCDNFTISGSLSYDNKKTSIFITKVNYCGGDDKTEYSDIECILYETNDNTEVKVSSYNYHQSEKIKLEDFLETVEFTVDDYERTCKVYTNNNLYIRINATDESGKTTTYKIPMSLNEKCE